MVVGIRQTIRGDQGGQRQLNPRVHSDGVQGDNNNQENNSQGKPGAYLKQFRSAFFSGEAPSTSAIIRSKKLLPGSEVMRIFSQSDTTVVPP